MNKIKISNLRFGLATNSSSSHSLIFLDENAPINDEQADGNFGWEFFTAHSRESKELYLTILLLEEFRTFLPDNVGKALVKSWINPQGEIDDLYESIDDWRTYIDHQSKFAIPYTTGPLNTKFVNQQFFNELKDFFFQENLAILGGNDNDEEVHPLSGPTSFTLDLPYDPRRYGIKIQDQPTARKDEVYNYWTIFHPISGTKVRFRLGEGEYNNNIERASAPELVDIKITDFCPFNCDFCYQDSDLEGLHAYSGYQGTYTTAKYLGQLGVFEVALGGGEPTMHPDFVNILKQFRENGIVPNFTTRNIAWMRDAAQCHEIMNLAGNFAFSVSKAKDVERMALAAKNAGIDSNRIAVHLVMGTIDRPNFVDVYKACGNNKFKLTLLGYKDVGRGTNQQPMDYDWWLNTINQLRNAPIVNPKIAIDTVLANEFEQQILDANIPPWMFHTLDGKFSCYIDAVSNEIGPSSYCLQDEMISFESKEDIQDVFQTF